MRRELRFIQSTRVTKYWCLFALHLIWYMHAPALAPLYTPDASCTLPLTSKSRAYSRLFTLTLLQYFYSAFVAI